MRNTTFICVVVSAVTILNGNGASQKSTVPKLKSSADLVLVPVVVHKGGAHLGNLKQSEFILIQDGQPQEIAVFEEIHTNLPVSYRADQPTEFTNSRAKSENPERLTVIAIDLVNTAPLDQAYLKQEISKFLDSARKTGEPYMLLTISARGVTVVQNFTTDPTAVAAAVQKMAIVNTGQEAVGKTGSWFLDSTPCALSAAGCGNHTVLGAKLAARDLTDWEFLYKNEEGYQIYRDRNSRLDTLSSLQQVAQYLQGFPGRKSLVWAGSGIQWFGGMTRVMAGFRDISPIKDYNTVDLRAGGQNLDANMHTLQLLSAANVSVYPLDARHGANTSFAVFDVTNSDAPVGDRGFAAVKGRVQNDDQERITMFQQIAAATGGKPCFNRTDLANCLQEFSTDSHDYYMLGYYIDKKTKPGWHTLSVKVDQKAELRHRNGFIFTEVNQEQLRVTDLQLAMISPLPYTALQFSGRIAKVEEKAGKKTVQFELDLPADELGLGEKGNLLNFDVVVVARGVNGKEAAKFAQRIDKTLQHEQVEVIQANGVHYTNHIELPTGTYGLWFVVRDNTSGHTGSVTTSLRLE